MKKIGLLFALIFVFFVSVSVSAPAEFYSPKPDGKYDNHVFLVDPQRFGVVALKNSVVRLENETDSCTHSSFISDFIWVVIINA